MHAAKHPQKGLPIIAVYRTASELFTRYFLILRGNLTPRHLWLQSPKHHRNCQKVRYQLGREVCEHCGIHVTSNDLAHHLQGAKHATRLEMFSCEPCGVTPTTGAAQILAHLNGARHAVRISASLCCKSENSRERQPN